MGGGCFLIQSFGHLDLIVIGEKPRDGHPSAFALTAAREPSGFAAPFFLEQPRFQLYGAGPGQ